MWWRWRWCVGGGDKVTLEECGNVKVEVVEEGGDVAVVVILLRSTAHGYFSSSIGFGAVRPRHHDRLRQAPIHGDLKPYAIFRVDPDRRLTTKPDDSGSSRPVWNDRFLVPLTFPLHDSFLTVEIFHSYSFPIIGTSKPFVGTLRFPLHDLVDSNRLRTFQLLRPSGRPQGKGRVKLALRERPSPPCAPDYHITAPPSYCYSTAPPPLHRGYSTSPCTASLPALSAPISQVVLLPTHAYGAYSDPNSGHYSQPSPRPFQTIPPTPIPITPPPRPSFDCQSSSGGPSAPVDYTPYDQRPKGAKMRLGTGLAVGAVAGALGGLALEEGLKYEEDRIYERVENDLAARNDCNNCSVDY